MPSTVSFVQNTEPLTLVGGLKVPYSGWFRLYSGWKRPRILHHVEVSQGPVACLAAQLHEYSYDNYLGRRTKSTSNENPAAKSHNDGSDSEKCLTIAAAFKDGITCVWRLRAEDVNMGATTLSDSASPLQVQIRFNGF